MYDTYQMQEHICKELEKKAQAGIKTSADLDVVWKLIDAYKNLLKIDMLQEASDYAEYNEKGGYGHNEGYSERRKRDSRGRYSREGGQHGYEGGSSYRGGYSEARDRYMEDKHSYRYSRSADSKHDMNVSLEDCMNKLKMELDEMEANADTREERDKIREMRREIGKLA
jgi:hypothetical protein